MIEQLKKKIYDSIFRSYKFLRRDKKANYELLKLELEGIYSLKGHDSWKRYEERLVNLLYQCHKSMKYSVTEGTDKKASYYAGWCDAIEHILYIPKSIEEREERLREELSRNDRPSRETNRTGRKVSGIVSI